MIANRILSKLRNGEVGRKYAERMLTEVSGVSRAPDEPANEYVQRALGNSKINQLSHYADTR